MSHPRQFRQHDDGEWREDAGHEHRWVCPKCQTVNVGERCVSVECRDFDTDIPQTAEQLAAKLRSFPVAVPVDDDDEADGDRTDLEPTQPESPVVDESEGNA